MVPRMCQVVLVLPTSQHNEMRVFFLITLLCRLWKVTHGLYCNKTRTLFAIFVEFISRNKLFAAHTNCIQFCYPILEHHNLSLKVFCKTMKNFFFSKSITIKIELQFSHRL